MTHRNVIAILRGIRSSEAAGIAGALIEAGITRIEVPLNSPDPFEAIEAMVDAHGDAAIFGGGTVTTMEQVAHVYRVGGTMVVSPNTDKGVIYASKTLGMESWPGCLTPTECFEALRWGATGLKIFPAFMLGTEGLRAIRAVLPQETQLYMVGGVGPDAFAEWREAGASGFGLGTSLYRPGDTAEDIAPKAREAARAWDAL